MLQDWYQPEHGSVWVEQKVMAKLHGLKLAPEQQSSVGSGIRFDQWALGRTQSQQPFNDLCRQLISSISVSRQASTMVMANDDHVVAHHHKIDQATANAAKEAFLPIRERDLYQLDPQFTVLGELDPSYKGPIFPDFCLEELDLEAIMGDLVPHEIQIRILMAVRQSHSNNLQMVQFLDSKIRSLYTAASGLINNRVETLRGYGWVQTTLDVCQQ